MAESDIGDDADIRASHFRKAVHLTEMVDTHLKHCNLVFISNIEDCQRKPDFVVKVSSRFKNMIFLLQNRGDHLFCTCLSDTSGDTDHFDVKCLAVMFCNIFERLLTGVNKNVWVRYIL